MLEQASALEFHSARSDQDFPIWLRVETFMFQVVQNNRSGQISVVEVSAPGASPGQIVVQNLYSVVSAGTEKAGVDFARSSLLGKARSRPDLVQQVLKQVKQHGLVDTYRKVRDRLDVPQPLGYSTAGIVTAVGGGVEDILPGMLVACAGVGYASHAEYVSVPKNLVVPVPAGVSSQAACFATLGAISIQGIRRADLTPGESVCVLGLGLIGQITVQILKAYGFPVMGVDVDKSRVDESLNFGMDLGAVVGSDDIPALAKSFSGGYGVDAAIITAASSDSTPVELAGEIVRERGRVSAVGTTGTEIPRRIYYAKELDFKISRSYGPGRYDTSYEEYGLDYPLPWVRWTEQRNMQEFLRLVESGSVKPDLLVTHQIPIAEAERAYSLVTGSHPTERFLGVLIEYPTKSTAPKRTISMRGDSGRKAPKDTLKLGLVGAGLFMAGTIVPSLKKLDKTSIVAVASARGLSAKDLAAKVGAQTSSSDYKELIGNKNIDVIVSATQHNLSAQIVIDALASGKSVHVEKPLALSVDDLRRVADSVAATSASLNVGFNRRFAPLVSQLATHFAGRTTPLSMSYRINAGWMDPDHWMHDPVLGGGRILGEVCHFLDLLQHLCEAKPTRIYATALPSNGMVVLDDDNVSVLVDFADGSRGTILYSALGASGQSKERIEIIGSGKSAELDDFRSLKTWTGIKETKHKGKMDKGHNAMFRELADSWRSGGPAVIPFDELAASTLAAIAIIESLKTGQPVNVDVERLSLSAAGSLPDSTSVEN